MLGIRVLQCGSVHDVDDETTIIAVLSACLEVVAAAAVTANTVALAAMMIRRRRILLKLKTARRTRIHCLVLLQMMPLSLPTLQLTTLLVLSPQSDGSSRCNSGDINGGVRSICQ